MSFPIAIKSTLIWALLHDYTETNQRVRTKWFFIWFWMLNKTNWMGLYDICKVKRK